MVFERFNWFKTKLRQEFEVVVVQLYGQYLVVCMPNAPNHCSACCVIVPEIRFLPGNVSYFVW